MRVRGLPLCLTSRPPSSAPTVSQAGRRQGKKKRTKSIQCTPPLPLLFFLLCVTNLKCPAGTNYSILMSAVSNNCICWVCSCLIHADHQHRFSDHLSSNEATCLVLTSWLGISVQSHQGWGTIRTAEGVLVFEEVNDCGPSWQGINQSGWWLQQLESSLWRLKKSQFLKKSQWPGSVHSKGVNYCGEEHEHKELGRFPETHVSITFLLLCDSWQVD